MPIRKWVHQPKQQQQINSMAIVSAINLFFSVFLVDVDAFTPNTLLPCRQNNLQPLRDTLAAESVGSSSTVDDSSKPRGFWYQPESAIRSRLKSQPPDEILAQIQAEPYRGAFEPVQDFSRPVTPTIVQGLIPADLVGTLAINSAGRIRVGGRLFGHWFDGDGYMTTLSFDGKNNEARAFGRYIRNDRFKAQEEQDKKEVSSADNDVNHQPPLAFSGAWTKAGSGNWYENIGKTPQSPANTAVMWLPPLNDSTSSKPRLFALCEGGNPIQLDPTTLEVVREEAPFTSAPNKKKETVSSFFSAHFAQDPQTQEIINHGYVLDPISSSSSINLMKLSPDGYLLNQQMSSLPYNTFVHDATISQNLYMYFVGPYVVPKGMTELVPFISGQEALGKMMTWKGEGGNTGDVEPLNSYLHVHSKDDLHLKWKIEIPHPMSVYHIVDAFEEDQEGIEGGSGGDTVLKIRIAELNSASCNRNKLEKQFSNQYAVPSEERLHAKLTEYTFLLQDDGSGQGKLMSTKDFGSSACEYPATNQVGRDKRLQYTWVNALHDKSSGWFDAVQKIDMINCELSPPIASFGQGTYCGPPLFVPKGCLSDATDKTNMQQYDEDEGYIIVTLYRSKSHSSDIAILDSSSMELLCTMELDCHLPYSFHGEFQNGFITE